MRVDWKQGARAIEIEGRVRPLPGPIEQALEWPGQPRVAVLLARSEGRARLLVLDAEGDTLARLEPPQDFELYYLERDPTRGITAVCTTNAAIDGWSDWRFLISVERGVLERIGPSK